MMIIASYDVRQRATGRTMSVLDRLEFYLMHFMPYPDVVPGRPQGQWVDIPNTHFDPEKGHKLYKEYLDELVLGDELGYDALVVNEHHSTFYSLMPSCSVIAGALTARTRQARICVFGTPITLTYPHRLAEEYAMLDVMSGGRLECAFPLGTGMEYWVNPLNPTNARERFRESMDVLMQAWTNALRRRVLPLQISQSVSAAVSEAASEDLRRGFRRGRYRAVRGREGLWLFSGLHADCRPT